MTSPVHGPGIDWLAQRAGTTPERLLRDPASLIDALAGAARDAVDLASRLGSDDPVTRRRAEVEARAARARFAPTGGPTPGERFAATVARGLQEAAVRAQQRGADGRYDPDNR
jgi:hypothetical protein